MGQDLRNQLLEKLNLLSSILCGRGHVLTGRCYVFQNVSAVVREKAAQLLRSLDVVDLAQEICASLVDSLNDLGYVEPTLAYLVYLGCLLQLPRKWV